jgi:hypothetical protein
MIMNWAVVLQWLWRKKHSSWVPVVGGALAAAGTAIVPYSPVNTLWWIPLFVDWGCIPGLAFTIAFYVWRSFTQKGNHMK